LVPCAGMPGARKPIGRRGRERGSRESPAIVAPGVWGLLGQTPVTTRGRFGPRTRRTWRNISFRHRSKIQELGGYRGGGGENDEIGGDLRRVLAEVRPAVSAFLLRRKPREARRATRHAPGQGPRRVSIPGHAPARYPRVTARATGARAACGPGQRGDATISDPLEEKNVSCPFSSGGRIRVASTTDVGIGKRSRARGSTLTAPAP